MKYRWLGLSTFLLFYSAISPVFVNTGYAIGEQVSLNEDETYYGVSAIAESNFEYYWFFSKANYFLTANSFDFYILDNSKEMDKFELVKLTASIDNKDYEIENTFDQAFPFDKSVTNGYAGRQGVLEYELTLPVIPNETIILKVTGYTYDDNGSRKKISVKVPCTIYKKEYVRPLYKYLIGVLGT